MLKIPDFELLSEVYSRGPRKIFRALRKDNLQPVLLKTQSDHFPSPEQLAGVRAEYRMLTKFEHPGILKPYELISHANGLVLVMEDFGGQASLKTLPESKASLATRFKLALSITEILAHVHQRQVIHKDINPANFFWNPSLNKVQLIDFEFASELRREVRPLTDVRLIQGTLAYMSPEQTGRINRPLDYRCDLYALGITLYWLFTEKLPFYASDPIGWVHAHLTQAARPAHEENAALPPSLSDIIGRLMEKSAEKRYQTAVGLGRDLERCYQEWQEGSPCYTFELGKYDFDSTFRLPVHMYGRDNEIKQLLSSLEKVTWGKGAAVFVGGASGVGKSMLIRELHEPITRLNGIFISGKFDQLSRNIPYGPIVAAFSSAVSQYLAGGEAETAHWVDNLIGVLGENAQLVLEVIPQLSAVLEASAPLPELDGEAAQMRFIHVFTQFVSVCQSSERPLALWLDDLQWMDPASVALLKALVGNPDLPYFLFIGAYREAEHNILLSRWLNDLRAQGDFLSELELLPLQAHQVRALVAQTFRTEEEEVAELARLCFQKTRGNPFALNNFLVSLYEEGLVHFHEASGRWLWNIEDIELLDLSDNVVILLSARIRKLPQATQELLPLAACIGNVFDLESLALVAKQSRFQTSKILWRAVVEELVTPLDDAYRSVSREEGDDVPSPYYRFVHDRVQQASYDLIPPDRRARFHLEIGRLLLRKEETIPFAVVNHLNLGVSLIEDPEERKRLALFNLDAGNRARASAAFDAAFLYFHQGIELLSPHAWVTDYNLCLALHIGGAQAALLIGRYETMNHLIEVVSNRGKDPLDKVKVLRIQIQANLALNQAEAAVRTGLQALSILGIRFPKNPGPVYMKWAMFKARALYWGVDIEGLAYSQEMDDPRFIAAMPLLLDMTTACSFVNLNLTILLALMRDRLSVKHGIAAASAPGFASYGSTLCYLGEVRRGYRFGQLALGLLRRSRSHEYRGRTLVVVNKTINHWSCPLQDSLPLLEEAHQASLDSGDLFYAGHALCVRASHMLWMGVRLDELVVVLEQAGQVAQRHQQQTAQDFCNLHLQFVHNLLAEDTLKTTLKGMFFDEDTFWEAQNREGGRRLACFLHLSKAILLYLAEQFDEAQVQINRAVEQSALLADTVYAPMICFYHCLILLANHGPHHKQDLGLVKHQMARLGFWAKEGVANYANKYLLIKARLLEVEGRSSEVANHLEAALAAAARYGFVHEEAMTHEAAARFFLRIDQEHLGRYHLERAISAFRQWGALSKVKKLELTCRPALVEAMSISGNYSERSFDLDSVLKAGQALSEEIQLEKLCQKMMAIMVENGGAENGTLILNEEGGLWVVAHATCVRSSKGATNIDIQFHHRLHLQACKGKGAPYHLPLSVIRYVARVMEPVVIDNADGRHMFKGETYFANHAVKSVLCCPLVRQGQVAGVLYLENNLNEGVFTRERLRTLQMLASQTAISLENARLYAHLEVANRDLEGMVENRTRQLEEKNLQITASNNQILSNIRHAQRLQRAFLPDEDYMRRVLPRAFNLYLPKQIVSGDFIWMHDDERYLWVAVMDCTGHGVSGAFMSLIGSALLDKHIVEQKLTEPGVVLSRMHESVRRALKQDHARGQAMDGMEGGLLRIDRSTGTICFAGACVPFYVVRNGAISEVKGYQKPIGGRQKEPVRIFPDSLIDTTEGDMVYLISDGYADQVNHAGRRFGSKRLKRLLQEIAHCDLEIQRTVLIEHLLEFQGDGDRRDDITVLGIRT